MSAVGLRIIGGAGGRRLQRREEGDLKLSAWAASWRGWNAHTGSGFVAEGAGHCGGGVISGFYASPMTDSAQRGYLYVAYAELFRARMDVRREFGCWATEHSVTQLRKLVLTTTIYNDEC